MSAINRKPFSYIHYPEYWEISPKELLNIIFAKADNLFHCDYADSLLFNWFGAEYTIIIQNAQILLWIERHNKLFLEFDTMRTENTFNSLIEIICNQNLNFTLFEITNSLPTKLQIIFTESIQTLSKCIFQDFNQISKDYILN